MSIVSESKFLTVCTFQPSFFLFQDKSHFLKMEQIRPSEKQPSLLLPKYTSLLLVKYPPVFFYVILMILFSTIKGSDSFDIDVYLTGKICLSKSVLRSFQLLDMGVCSFALIFVLKPNYRSVLSLLDVDIGVVLLGRLVQQGFEGKNRGVVLDQNGLSGIEN